MKIEDVLLAIRSWNNEANNFRNDGWVQEHYRCNISKVASLLESFSSKKQEDMSLADKEYKALNEI